MNTRPRLFISYSAKDMHIAEQLHKLLEAAGFEVWRDQTRLETNWSREIAVALAETEALCLIWTECAARSKWVKHEWLTARALEKLIVPCLFSRASALPEPLFNTQGVVFEDTAKDSNKLIGRMKSETSFKVKYDYTILPPNSYIPFNPNPNFTGRQLDLVELYLKMIGNLIRRVRKRMSNISLPCKAIADRIRNY